MLFQNHNVEKDTSQKAIHFLIDLHKKKIKIMAVKV